MLIFADLTTAGFLAARLIELPGGIAACLGKASGYAAALITPTEGRRRIRKRLGIEL